MATTRATFVTWSSTSSRCSTSRTASAPGRRAADEDTARGVLKRLKPGHRPCGVVRRRDRNPPVFDPRRTRHAARVVKKSTSAVGRRVVPPGPADELGGFGIRRRCSGGRRADPGANPAAFMYMRAPASRDHAQERHDEQKRWRRSLDRAWAPRCAHEPDAARTWRRPHQGRAPADGSWHLDGVKRFITSATDMTENIMHMVLARPRPQHRVAAGTKA